MRHIFSGLLLPGTCVGYLISSSCDVRLTIVIGTLEQKGGKLKSAGWHLTCLSFPNSAQTFQRNQSPASFVALGGGLVEFDKLK